MPKVKGNAHSKKHHKGGWDKRGDGYLFAECHNYRILYIVTFTENFKSECYNLDPNIAKQSSKEVCNEVGIQRRNRT